MPVAGTISTGRGATPKNVTGFLSLLAVLFLSSCDLSAPLPTVDGPEDQALLSEATGTLLTAGPGRSLVATTLPDLAQRVVRKQNGKNHEIFALSGPERDGKIALIENRADIGQHALLILDRGGKTSQTVFERPGNAIWEHVIGRSIALSPVEGRVALIGRHAVNVMHDPEASLSVGALEIWSIASGKRDPIERQALDHGLAWFSDGRRLAYTALVPQERIVAEQPGRAIGGGFARWPRVPAIMIADLATGEDQFVTVGWDPMVSPDDESILFTDATGIHWVFHLITRTARPVEWPGNWGGPVAFVREKVVLYWGLPTTGLPEQLVEKGGPIFGAKGRATLKLADFETGRFKTIAGPLDPRWVVSYGR